MEPKVFKEVKDKVDHHHQTLEAIYTRSIPVSTSNRTLYANEIRCKIFAFIEILGSTERIMNRLHVCGLYARSLDCVLSDVEGDWWYYLQLL